MSPLQTLLSFNWYLGGIQHRAVDRLIVKFNTGTTLVIHQWKLTCLGFSHSEYVGNTAWPLVTVVRLFPQQWPGNHKWWWWIPVASLCIISTLCCPTLNGTEAGINGHVVRLVTSNLSNWTCPIPCWLDHVLGSTLSRYKSAQLRARHKLCGLTGKL